MKLNQLVKSNQIESAHEPVSSSDFISPSFQFPSPLMRRSTCVLCDALLSEVMK